ncbi:MAG: cell envelope integrity protein CreD [Bacteroidales bacterium]
MSNNFKTWIRESITVKFIVIGTLTLLLLIPAAMIRNLVEERKERRDEVIREISSKWGNAQTITGPVLTVPFRKYQTNNNQVTYTVHYAHFLPEELTIDGILTPVERNRALYKVVLYKSDLKVTGRFSHPDFGIWKTDPATILWDEAFITVGIPDMRGIKQGVSIQFNGTPLEVNPGVPTRQIVSSGVSARIPLHDTATGDYPFEFTLHLNGSESIEFVPLGKTTHVQLRAPWDSPSFDGAFLPDERELTDSSFVAQWTILHLNRNFPQQWQGEEYDANYWSFGVNLKIPVDHYQKSERSVKYAIMFIALTFLTFFFSEVLNKKRVHPIQYLLIGFALCIFYVLLLSLSEQIGFTWAYIVAAVANIVLITAYSASILKRRKLIVLVGFILVALYTFLFTILQLEDYSLLMGSIGLFIVMALIMYLSRNVKWQGSGEKVEGVEDV